MLLSSEIQWAIVVAVSSLVLQHTAAVIPSKALVNSESPSSDAIRKAKTKTRVKEVPGGSIILPPALDNFSEKLLLNAIPKPKGMDKGSLNELVIDIFGEYHKELVPKRPTTVKLDMLLIKVKSTNEREGIFETVIALFMEWKDRRLVWEPTKYDNTTVLAFDSDKVWLPDIAMTNSADHLYSISKDTRFVVRVSSDGSMKFVPTGTSRSWCELKLITFPFDVQTCSFDFESWALDSSTMTLNKTSSALVDESFSSPQWELCTHRSTVYDHFYDFSGENFTRVRFDFVVRRKSTFYIINLIFPCTTLSMIQLLVFVIPSTDATSDRVAFGTTNLLTLVVFQTIITEEMPKSSDSVTALSKYIIALIIISAIGILESVTAERMLRPTATPPPEWAARLRVPLLWDSQLPSGISQMMLQLWTHSDGKNMPPGVTDKNEKKRTKTGRKKSSLALKNVNLPVIQTISPSSSGQEIASEASTYSKRSSDVFVKPRTSDTLFRSKFSQIEPYTQARNSSESKKAMRPAVLDLDYNNWDTEPIDISEHRDSYTEKMRPMVHSPSFQPQYGLFGGLAPSPIMRNASYRKGRPPTNYLGIAQMVAVSASGDSFGSSMVGAPAAAGTVTEKELIAIAQSWGAIVTRLDGLTFVLCAVSAVFLPLLLFLPIALMDEQCNV